MWQNSAIAQSIIPEANSAGTIVNVNEQQINIHGGTLSRDRLNLFHSFEKFGLDAGQIANFLSTPGIQNILGRVVGSETSIVDGLIQVTGGNANLFLMNPAGIIFGANASLNVPGDFTATTATGIGFGNNGWFDAFGSNDYQNLIGNPTQFAFDLEQPAAIVNHGNLAAQNLTLLGGSVTSTGTLQGNNIIISAVPGENLVRLSKPGHLLNLELPRDRIKPDFSALDIPRLLTGNPGATNVSETVDASNPNGFGGQITVLGEIIYIDGHLNASGQFGGGNIFIGGDYLGGGELPTANYTNITDSSTIRADAIANGNGGRIIIWSDKTTNAGNAFISARGGLNGGHGGLIETSGKENLFFTGLPDLKATNGETGTWTIDPFNILVTPGVMTFDDLTPIQIAAIEAQIGESIGTPFVLEENRLETSANVDILAGKHVIIMDNLNDNKLSIQNNLDINVGTGSIFLNSDVEVNGAAEINAPGSIQAQNLTTKGGNIILNAGEAIATGNLTTNGGDLTLTSLNGSIKTGSLNSAPPLLPLQHADGGQIEVRAGNNIDIAGQIRSNGTLFGDGSNVLLDAGNNIAIADGASLTGWKGGDFTAIAGGDFLSEAPIATLGTHQAGNILIQVGGNIANADLHAAAGSVGGTGGAIDLIAGGNLTVGNAIVDSANGVAGSLNFKADGEIQTGFLSARGAVPGGGDVAIASVGNALIELIDVNGNVNIATQNSLNLPGIQSPGDFSIRTNGNVDIATRTPLAIADWQVGQSFTFGAILTGGLTIANLDLAINTTLPNFTFTRLASTFPTPPTLPLTPIAIAAPSSWSEAIGRALEQPLTTATTPEATTLHWGSYFLALPNTPEAIAPLTDTSTQIATITNPIQAIEQSENRFTQTYLETYPEIEDREAIDFPEIRRTLDTIFETTGQNTAILYVWWDVEGLRIGLVRRDRDPVVKIVKVARQDVELEVDYLFGGLTSNQLFNAKKLSQWLIAPIANELEGVETILTSFDDGLRNIPVAALRDGEDLLIKKYNLATIPSVALMEVSETDLTQAKVLAMGASEFTDSNIGTLNFVPLELEAIQKYRTGHFFLNEEFTADKIAKYPAQIVHLATHANFNRFYFYNETLSIEEFKQITQRQRINLLILSACNTALDAPSKEQEEMGFAGLSARTNIDSTIASRWVLNDGATALFMELFYKHLETKTKAEALRLAQLEFREHKLYYSPYYWAGFGLIGSP